MEETENDNNTDVRKENKMDIQQEHLDKFTKDQLVTAIEEINSLGFCNEDEKTVFFNPKHLKTKMDLGIAIVGGMMAMKYRKEGDDFIPVTDDYLSDHASGELVDIYMTLTGNGPVPGEDADEIEEKALELAEVCPPCEEVKIEPPVGPEPVVEVKAETPVEPPKKQRGRPPRKVQEPVVEVKEPVVEEKKSEPVVEKKEESPRPTRRKLRTQEEKPADVVEEEKKESEKPVVEEVKKPEEKKEEPPAETTPARRGRRKKEGVPKPHTITKYTRIDSVCEALKSGGTLQQIAKRSAELYQKKTGSVVSNVEKNLNVVLFPLKALEYFGVAENKNGVYSVKK